MGAGLHHSVFFEGTYFPSIAPLKMSTTAWLRLKCVFHSNLQQTGQVNEYLSSAIQKAVIYSSAVVYTYKCILRV